MKSCCVPVAALSPTATKALLVERDRFLGFLEHRVGSRDLAEEILHDAYAKALERGAQLRDDEHAVAWFFRILRNSVIERARRNIAAGRALEQVAREMDLGGAQDAPDGPRRAVCGCVNGVLATLKPEYQAPVRAVDLDGQGLRAFATDAGITANNAAVRLHRGREALRKRLQATCGACADRGCVDCTCDAKA